MLEGGGHGGDFDEPGYGLVIFGADLKGSRAVTPRPDTCFRLRVTKISP